MKLFNYPAKYEVLIKRYLRSNLDISDKPWRRGVKCHTVEFIIQRLLIPVSSDYSPTKWSEPLKIALMNCLFETWAH